MAETVRNKDIVDANRDLEKRVGSLDVKVSYDEEFDLFTLTLGDPQEAITEEVADGLHVRVDPESLKIVGYEILGFHRHFLEANPEFRPHFEALFDKSPMQTRKITPHGYQRKRAEDAVRELAPV